MSLRTLFVCLLIVSSVGNARSNMTTTATANTDLCPTLPAAEGYTLNQNYWTSKFWTDFRIQTQDGQRAGKITEKKLRMIRWGKVFRLKNAEGELVAYARKRVTPMFTKINIYNCHGRFIGGLRKNALRSMVQGQVANTFSVINERKQTISQSRKTEAANTEITFFDAQNSRVVAQARRPQINVVADTWDVQIYGDQNVFDPRLLLFAPVFKTASER